MEAVDVSLGPRAERDRTVVVRMSGENEKIIADLTKDLESQLRTEEPDEFQDAVSEVDDHKNDISDGDVDESEDEDERLRELESLLSEEEKQVCLLFNML